MKPEAVQQLQQLIVACQRNIQRQQQRTWPPPWLRQHCCGSSLHPARRVNLRARAGKGSIRVAVCSAARTVVLASGATFLLSLVLVQHETGESSVAGGVIAVTVQLVRLTPLQGPH